MILIGYSNKGSIQLLYQKCCKKVEVPMVFLYVAHDYIISICIGGE